LGLFDYSRNSYIRGTHQYIFISIKQLAILISDIKIARTEKDVQKISHYAI
jgi:hypothetical protein